MEFLVLMHEKITCFEAFIHPFFNAFHPFIYTGIICGVQAVSYKTYKTFGGGEVHMHTIATPGSIGYDGASFIFPEKIIEFGVIFIYIPFGMP